VRAHSSARPTDPIEMSSEVGTGKAGETAEMAEEKSGELAKPSEQDGARLASDIYDKFSHRRKNWIVVIVSYNAFISRESLSRGMR
jgi:hypothetical protein